MAENLDTKVCTAIGLEIAARLSAEIKKAVLQSYGEAGLSGLCEEGRLEVALGAIDSLPVDQLVRDVVQRAANRSA